MTPVWSPVNDGIVSGKLLHRTIACDVCGVPTCVVRVEDYKFPDEVWWQSTIVYLRKNETPIAVNLGVGCGCYAKFHRQVAHIRDSIEEGREFPQT
jgi:hypothetical protein